MTVAKSARPAERFAHNINLLLARNAILAFLATSGLNRTVECVSTILLAIGTGTFGVLFFLYSRELNRVFSMIRESGEIKEPLEHALDSVYRRERRERMSIFLGSIIGASLLMVLQTLETNQVQATYLRFIGTLAILLGTLVALLRRVF